MDSDPKARRFPLDHVEPVEKGIATALNELKAQALVSSAACGADLLGLRVAGQLRLERYVVLPFIKSRFRETSVVDRPGDWGQVFDQIMEELERVGHVKTLALDESDEASYHRTNEVILSWASELAKQAKQLAGALVVWDGISRGAQDVTAAFREEAKRRGFALREVLTKQN